MMVSAQKSATKPAQAKPAKTTPPAADLEYEQQLFASGARTVAGIDEVGRGSMAGPVTVGVAILTPDATLEVGGLIDSKALSPARRESMVPEIRQWCAVAVGHVEPADIDRLGMTLSLRLAAQRALAELARRGYRADAALLDGKHDWFTLRRKTCSVRWHRTRRRHTTTHCSPRLGKAQAVQMSPRRCR